ncbi:MULTISPECIES: exodeoxyribonuclease VII small subunit [Clostridium]|jgi:exodeoxyribonuclease VII small subunit|uniref:Exodeoxyribonuclease 7 small subunit n=1 Tax=Clostridium saccharoperbutylacetonicum N1-4(HMT) TaxID=931276 RepID=M1MP49_9CLOT|nr:MULTISPECIES: exodeoxyribonuclease VII small subunit [Clostridium]AGF56511.1 exodeoxyribonuclease VII small subunit [Clostridium saccharoperbutylacetonicum N1-4(HMT)]NRT62742.1 exodeoxyribonuclease VII small subunit [Clostridium saccharoperbutylacetonicum]NSB26094.1 exodeoxyribonuclease VII small subunit [Clostridium saccharoperbutylacetonicum]NSB45449.1 exodeoxyribonuclease VII small subunit [Clostridium saccharoperbutylacetonicum]
MAKKESYEEMLIKLQEILNNLENDELNLEESMKSYEEGVKLINKIYKVLDSYEAKISIIKEEKEVEFNDGDGDK